MACMPRRWAGLCRGAKSGAAGEEVGALHDAVAHGLDVIKAAEHSVGGIHEKVEDEPHSDLVVRYRKFLGIGFLAGGLMGHLSFGKTDFLDYAFCQKIVDIVAFHIKELVLDGRAAAVDY